jgi:hypothetical protein
MSDPSSNDQLSALKPQCHLQRAPFLDDDQRSWEITYLNGEFFLYKLHDTGYRWIGRFPNLMLAYVPTKQRQMQQDSRDRRAQQEANDRADQERRDQGRRHRETLLLTT